MIFAGQAALIAMLAVSPQAATEQASPQNPDILAERVVAASTADRELLLARDDHATLAVVQALNAAGARERIATGCARSLIAFQAAEVIARKIQANSEIGRALNGRAECMLAQTNLDRALAVARESVRFHEAHGDPGALAEAWNTTANIYFYQSDYDNALAAHLRARELWTATGDRAGVGRSANNIGNIHKALAQFDAAAKSYDEALAIFDALDDWRRAGVVSSNIALVHFSRGDYPRALDYATRSLDLAERAADPGPISKALDTLGNIYRAQGAYSRALSAFRRSLAMRTALGDRYAAAESETNIGLVHFSQGDDAVAIDAYKRGLRLAKQAGALKGLVSDSLLHIAGAAWRLGQKTRARANVRESIEIAEREGWPTVIASAAQALGAMALADGRHAEAHASFLRALALREELKDHAGTAESLNGLARVMMATGQPDAALEHARRATGVTERYGQVELLWESRTLSGMAERRLGDAGAARASFTEAIHVIERLRREVGGAPLGRERFFESKLSPYHELIALSIAAGDLAGALSTAERAKARVLADLLQDRAAPAAASAPEDAAAPVVDASTAILEYVITGDAASVFVLSNVNGRAALDHFVIPSPSAALAARVRRFRDRLASRDLLVAQDARVLHDLLLAPAASRLAGKSRLIVVPDGPLWEVPFQALQDRSNRYVVETAAITYAPSLTVLRETLRTRPDREGPRTLLAMGNALPEAEAQVEALRTVYGARGRVYVGAAATEQRFKSEATGPRLIHLASHGIFDQKSPRYSYLALSREADSREDGMLEAWELASMKLDADLVVLSACETGRGRIALGEGSVGTMWAVLAAGARATVVSQWMVEASSTTELMTAFHRRLARGDGATADHLRRATLELMTDPRYRHPFYWAPFILVGNPH